ncbi:MAG TPA: hypothetical protein VF662_08750 [Allosphingosinicella sp.]|jgi:hypothetical protein
MPNLSRGPIRIGLIASPVGAALMLLAGCTSPTPYQPLSAGSKTSGGYSDQQIADNRYRVSFAGNSFTSRQQVENYLLLRAAQLTLQKGFDGFTMVSRSTDPNTRTTVTRDPLSAGPWGYWGPSWRYRSGGFGWRSWDPWLGSPFWAVSVDVQTVTSYEASAEIVMYRGSRSDDPTSFDARQVEANLAPGMTAPS